MYSGTFCLGIRFAHVTSFFKSDPASFYIYIEVLVCYLILHGLVCIAWYMTKRSLSQYDVHGITETLLLYIPKFRWQVS